jgi:hypothetical protein
MEYHYRVNDWPRLAPGREGRFSVRGIDVPYAVFANEPEVTDKPEELGRALDDVFGKLWRLRSARP